MSETLEAGEGGEMQAVVSDPPGQGLDLREGLRRRGARRSPVDDPQGQTKRSRRRGTQEGAGELSLGELPCRMLIHDRSHLAELRYLLAALRRGALADHLDVSATVGACA